MPSLDFVIAVDDSGATGAVNRFGDKVKSAGDRGGRAVTAVGQKMVGVGARATAVGVAVVAGFALAVTATAAYGDQLDKTSIRTGVSVEQLSALKFAAEQSGSSFETLTGGLQKLSRNAAEAAAGTAAQKEAFDQLGVSVTDASGNLRPMQDLLLDSADQFAQMTNATEKSALAQELFGRAGADLLPLLNQGAAGIGALTDQASKLGLVMSTETASSAASYSDAMNEVKSAVGGVSQIVASALLPVLTDILRKISPVITIVGEWIAKNQGLTKAIAAAGAVLLGAGGLITTVGALLIVIGPLIPILGTVVAVLSGPVGLVIAIGLGIAAIFKFRREIAVGLTKVLKSIIGELTKVVDAVAWVADAIGLDGLSATLKQATASANGFAEGLENAAIQARDTRAYEKLRDAQTQNVADTLAQIQATEEARLEQKALNMVVAETPAVLEDMGAALSATREEFDAATTATEAWSTAFTKSIEAAQTEAAGLDLGATMTAQMQDAFAATDTGADNIVTSLRGISTDSQAGIEAIGTIFKEVVDANIAAQGELESFIKETNANIVADDAEAAAAIVAASDAAAEARKKNQIDWGQVATQTMAGLVTSTSKALTDILFNGGSFKDKMVGIFKSIGESIVTLLINGALTRLAGKLTGVLSQVSGLGSILGGAGGSAAGSVGGQVAGGAAGNAIGGAAGGAFAGIGTGIISGGIGAIGGIVGGLMNSGSNKETAGATAELVRWVTAYWPEWSGFFGAWDVFIRQIDTWAKSIQGHSERSRFLLEFKAVPALAAIALSTATAAGAIPELSQAIQNLPPPVVQVQMAQRTSTPAVQSGVVRIQERSTQQVGDSSKPGTVNLTVDARGADPVDIERSFEKVIVPMLIKASETNTDGFSERFFPRQRDPNF